MTKDTIGIDVSKATLDVFWQSHQTTKTLPNSEDGFAQLCAWLGSHKDVLIVFEGQTMGLTGPTIVDLNGISARLGCPSSK